MKEGEGKVVGHNQEPIQHSREGAPTHACFHADGTTSVVYPEGHDPDTLVELPADYDETIHEIDHATRSFRVRETPLVRQRDAQEQLRELERQLAELRARLGGDDPIVETEKPRL